MVRIRHLRLGLVYSPLVIYRFIVSVEDSRHFEWSTEPDLPLAVHSLRIVAILLFYCILRRSFVEAVGVFYNG